MGIFDLTANLTRKLPPRGVAIGNLVLKCVKSVIPIDSRNTTDGLSCQRRVRNIFMTVVYGITGMYGGHFDIN